MADTIEKLLAQELAEYEQANALYQLSVNIMKEIPFDNAIDDQSGIDRAIKSVKQSAENVQAFGAQVNSMLGSSKSADQTRSNPSKLAKNLSQTIKESLASAEDLQPFLNDIKQLDSAELRAMTMHKICTIVLLRDQSSKMHQVVNLLSNLSKGKQVESPAANNPDGGGQRREIGLFAHTTPNAGTKRKAQEQPDWQPISQKPRLG